MHYMKSILTLSAILFFITAHAQTVDTVKEIKVYQVQARFPGGLSAWVKYLQNNLKADVAASVVRLRRHQQDSIQTVIVSFLVDTLGNKKEEKVENPENVDQKVVAEVKRVIQEGPKWIPGMQNGKTVIYRQRQSISFDVSRG